LWHTAATAVAGQATVQDPSSGRHSCSSCIVFHLFQTTGLTEALSLVRIVSADQCCLEISCTAPAVVSSALGFVMGCRGCTALFAGCAHVLTSCHNVCVRPQATPVCVRLATRPCAPRQHCKGRLPTADTPSHEGVHDGKGTVST
jgi:hypothetical protein